MFLTTILFCICFISALLFLVSKGSNLWFTVFIVSSIISIYQGEKISKEKDPKLEETKEYKTGYQHGYYDKGREIRFKKDSINEIKQ